MDHSLRLVLGDERCRVRERGQVELLPLDLATGESFPALDAPLHAGDRHKAFGAAQNVPATPDQVVRRDHVVPASRQVQRRRPAEISVGPEDDHAHVNSTFLVFILSPVVKAGLCGPRTIRTWSPGPERCRLSGASRATAPPAAGPGRLA